MTKKNKKIGEEQAVSLKGAILEKVHLGDARVISKLLPDDLINTTITSPPYFDLKDYGMPNQIGFGQKYDDYLTDLTTVFSEVFRATKDNGSLWIIIDTFRKDQEVLTLPFDLAAKLKPIGWILRDIIIWKKERTLPWTHVGSTRKIFEYILVFSKGTNQFRYDADKYREITNLKKWWVRYPERYNPRGKSIEEIWCYDIPTQGSWGDKYIRHFCPLPTELVSRIIQLTTESKDIVFDPFAGSGTVPTVSYLLKRSFVGIELNPKYIKMFENHFNAQKNKNATIEAEQQSSDSRLFEKKIIDLRILKFGRLILRNLRKELPQERLQVYSYQLAIEPDQKFKYYSVEYLILISKKQSIENVRQSIETICSKPPLSKFGIQAKISIISSSEQISADRKELQYFWYTHSNSHNLIGEGNFNESWTSNAQLLSPIKLEVREPNE